MKMSKEKIDISMFAPCGMNCKVCYKHCYNKKPCSGCLNSDKGKPEHCRKCKIKDCIKGKSLSYCFECAEYPCKLIKNLEKSYNKRYQASLIENSRFVQGHGLEHFMEQQKIKYTCPKFRSRRRLHAAATIWIFSPPTSPPTAARRKISCRICRAVTRECSI